MADGGANLGAGSDGPRDSMSGLERLIEIGLALSAERNHDRHLGRAAPCCCAGWRRRA